MNLFTAPTLSPAQHALATMQALHEDALKARARALQEAFNLFWHNDRATPADMAAALGTNAQTAFDLHASEGAALYALAPELFASLNLTPPKAYTFNTDGSLNLAA